MRSEWKEIGIPDLKGFRDLLPDAIYEKRGHDTRWADPAKRMVWEGPPLDETRIKLQELGVDSVVYVRTATNPERAISSK